MGVNDVPVSMKRNMTTSKKGTGDKAIEAMDDYLTKIGQWRKATAKDGSCLFRAVAEQLFLTQQKHLEVRAACVNYISRNKSKFQGFIEKPFDHYLFELRNPKEWAGQVEIIALSEMYKHDFLIYQDIDQEPQNVTQKGYDKQIKLCFSNGNHYDSVYPANYPQVAALCQSIVYELLYEKVFKVDSPLEIGHEMLSKHKRDRKDSFCSLPDNLPGGLENINEDSLSEQSKEQHLDHYPFPYRVARSLDPMAMRNIELESWTDAKKEQVLKNQDIEMSFSPGDKCQVLLESHANKVFTGHIQEMADEKGPVTVFIEDLGEIHCVPFSTLKPLPQPKQAWITAGGKQSYKQLSGYYQKAIQDTEPRTRRGKKGKKHQHHDTCPGHTRSTTYPGYRSVPTRRSSLTPAIMPRLKAPHYTVRLQNPGPENIPISILPSPQANVALASNASQIGNVNMFTHIPRMCDPNFVSPGPSHVLPSSDGGTDHEVNEKKLEESIALIEIKERDTTAFPALPTRSDANPISSSWPGAPTISNTGKVVSPVQRSPSPDAEKKSNFHGNVAQPNNTRSNLSSPSGQKAVEQVDSAVSPPSALQQTNMNPGMQMNGAQGGNIPQPSNISGIIPQAASKRLTHIPSVPHVTGYQHSQPGLSPAMPYQTAQCQPITTQANGYKQESQQVLPEYSRSVQASSLPFYPWMMVNPPHIDQSVNVNFSVFPSSDPNGNDLPHNDPNTLRYFFNLGLEYCRLCSIMQMQHQQQQYVSMMGQVSYQHPSPPQQTHAPVECGTSGQVTEEDQTKGFYQGYPGAAAASGASAMMQCNPAGYCMPVSGSIGMQPAQAQQPTGHVLMPQQSQQPHLSYTPAQMIRSSSPVPQPVPQPMPQVPMQHPSMHMQPYPIQYPYPT